MEARPAGQETVLDFFFAAPPNFLPTVLDFSPAKEKSSTVPKQSSIVPSPVRHLETFGGNLRRLATLATQVVTLATFATQVATLVTLATKL